MALYGRHSINFTLCPEYGFLRDEIFFLSFEKMVPELILAGSLLRCLLHVPFSRLLIISRALCTGAMCWKVAGRGKS
jgi:hypothetical protein